MDISVTTARLERSEDALARLALGDATAFADIVQEHQSMVFSIAYHFLHDRSLAEEAAQDVFLRLYRNLASIKSPQHLVFWLRKVACRRALDEVRKLPKTPPASLEDVAEPVANAQDSDPLLLSLRLWAVGLGCARSPLQGWMPEKGRMVASRFCILLTRICVPI